MNFDILMNDASKLVSQSTINLLWQTEVPQIRKKLKVRKDTNTSLLFV